MGEPRHPPEKHCGGALEVFKSWYNFTNCDVVASSVLREFRFIVVCSGRCLAMEFKVCWWRGFSGLH